MRGGRESVDHRRGAHDDVANVCAGLIATMATMVHDEDFFGFSNESFGGSRFFDDYPLGDSVAPSSLGDIFSGRRERHVVVTDAAGEVRDVVSIIDGDRQYDPPRLGDDRSDTERFLKIRKRRGRLV